MLHHSLNLSVLISNARKLRGMTVSSSRSFRITTSSTPVSCSSKIFTHEADWILRPLLSMSKNVSGREIDSQSQHTLRPPADPLVQSQDDRLLLLFVIILASLDCLQYDTMGFRYIQPELRESSQTTGDGCSQRTNSMMISARTHHKVYSYMPASPGSPR